jgi:hypothetical protein
MSKPELHNQQAGKGSLLALTLEAGHGKQS